MKQQLNNKKQFYFYKMYLFNMHHLKNNLYYSDSFLVTFSLSEVPE